MVTVAPVPADVGVNEVIVGAGINVNPDKLAVPPGVVTETEPEAPDATTAVIVVELTTLNEVAAVPPNVTEEAPIRLDPVMVTVVPVAAEVGVKEEIVGAGMKVKPTRLAVPPGVVTETEPEAPDATIAVIVLELTTLKDVAAVPPKLTAVAPGKLNPFIVIVNPVPEAVGV
jgi:SepF-like predicted cell division protein (DUF552 family)